MLATQPEDLNFPDEEIDWGPLAMNDRGGPGVWLLEPLTSSKGLGKAGAACKISLKCLQSRPRGAHPLVSDVGEKSWGGRREERG